MLNIHASRLAPNRTPLFVSIAAASIFILICANKRTSHAQSAEVFRSQGTVSRSGFSGSIAGNNRYFYNSTSGKRHAANHSNSFRRIPFYIKYRSNHRHHSYSYPYSYSYFGHNRNYYGNNTSFTSNSYNNVFFDNERTEKSRYRYDYYPRIIQNQKNYTASTANFAKTPAPSANDPWSLVARGESGKAVGIFALQIATNNTTQAKLGYAIASTINGDMKQAAWAYRQVVTPDGKHLKPVKLNTVKLQLRQAIKALQAEPQSPTATTSADKRYVIAIARYITGDSDQQRSALLQIIQQHKH
jgi:hypothetical protein